MIHGHKKATKQKSPEEHKQEEEMSEKINSKLNDFFAIRQKPITDDNLAKLSEFTAILMQLCSDIPTIFNFRRELMLKLLSDKSA